MIIPYKDKHFLEVFEFIKNNYDTDFYDTCNNDRIFINTEKDLNNLLSSSTEIYVNDNNEEITGIILLWKSVGNGIKRYYVKVNALNEESVDKLLTALLWNNGVKDLYIKCKKYSPYIKIFKDKGFVFNHFRGRELLLLRQKGKQNNVDGHNN